MRHWLLTNTTYGSWLPGNSRGSVTSVRDRRPGDPATPSRIEHDRPSLPWEGSLPGIYQSAVALLKASPIYFTRGQAEKLLEQFFETTEYRGWTMHAVSIMPSHFHTVLTVPGDPDPERLLIDLKAYGSRKLNREFGRPASDTWWTTRGSKQKLASERALFSAISYVLYKQENPLIVWSLQHGRLV